MYIPKETYKQLVDQSVELIKQNILNEKLKEVIKKKTAQLNELKRKISQHEYLLKQNVQKENSKHAESFDEINKKRNNECFVSIDCYRFFIHIF